MARSCTTFKKGQSGNPSGRPKVVGVVQELARQNTTKAINTLVAIMDDDMAPHSARVSAANSLLDRGFGKPPQQMAVGNDPDDPPKLEIIITDPTRLE